MTWTCQKCGKNHGDRHVEEELSREEIDGWYFPSIPDSDTVEGWICDRCGKHHPTPDRAPGDME